MPVFVTWST